MRVLVTGGAGFVGSHYVRSALQGRYPDLVGADLVVLDKLTYAGHKANLAEVWTSDRFEFVRGDISDARLVDSLMAHSDEVIHFAAESHVDRSIFGASAFVTTNVLGTQCLLEAALRNRVRRFVHVSTDEVYGSTPLGAWAEEHTLHPGSPYAASRASSDLMALAYAHTYRLPVVVTRCSSNYGPFQSPEKTIPLFVTNLLTGGSVSLHGDGHTVRSWIHVDDHCRAIDAARRAGREGEVYNVGGEVELSHLELTERLLNECGYGWECVDYVAGRPEAEQRYSVDSTKIHRNLGFSPRLDLDTGLRETVRWLRSNRAWWEPLRQRAVLGTGTEYVQAVSS